MRLANGAKAILTPAMAVLAVAFVFLLGLQAVLHEIADLRTAMLAVSNGPLHDHQPTDRLLRRPIGIATPLQASATTRLTAELREAYLNVVAMGLLGGLTHAAELDKNAQSSTKAGKSNQCLTRDWTTGDPRDFCIIKWDGYERLKRVQDLYETVRNDNIEGDLVECGVWRGAITIYMRALLKAYGDENRNVWVSDSFSGVPNTEQQKKHPSVQNIPDEIQRMDEKQWGGRVMERAIDGGMVEKNFLTVEGQLVQDNFRRFDLFDDKVKFLPGWFSESLPQADKNGLSKIAILRVDGDLYSSTMDVLVNLYQSVVPGGFLIFDDYNIGQSRKAIHDFFKQHGLDTNQIKQDRITGRRVNADANDPRADTEDGAYFRKPI